MKVVLNGSFRERHMEDFKKNFPNVQFYIPKGDEELFEAVKDADVLVTFMCSKELINAAKNIKWLQAISAGVEHLPLGDIIERNIILTNGKGIHNIHMSEYAIAAMIMLSRNLHTAFRNQIKGKWDKNIRQGEIFESTVGIIGIGSIGKEIARRAKFLGMNVIGLNTKGTPEEYIDKVYDLKNIEKVFEESDYVINLLPHTKETTDLIDKKCFDHMKKYGCFINIGRGKTVVEGDLIDALKDGRIRAAVLDVFYHEPLPLESPLWNMDNVVITPHLCGDSSKYLDKAMKIIKHNIKAYLENSPMINLVDIGKGY